MSKTLEQLKKDALAQMKLEDEAIEKAKALKDKQYELSIKKRLSSEKDNVGIVEHEKELTNSEKDIVVSNVLKEIAKLDKVNKVVADKPKSVAKKVKSVPKSIVVSNVLKEIAKLNKVNKVVADKPKSVAKKVKSVPKSKKPATTIKKGKKVKKSKAKNMIVPKVTPRVTSKVKLQGDELLKDLVKKYDALNMMCEAFNNSCHKSMRNKIAEKIKRLKK